MDVEFRLIWGRGSSSRECTVKRRSSKSKRPCSRNAAGSRPYFFQHLLRHFLFPCGFGGGGGGWGGWGWGGDKNIIHIASTPKTLVFTAFSQFVQPTVQGCGTRHVVTSVHAFCDHAQNTGVYAQKHWYLQHFRRLYNILRKDVEQEKHSQASLPLATMPKTLVFTVFKKKVTALMTSGHAPPQAALPS